MREEMTPEMTIQVNGEARALREGSTIQDLLGELGLNPGRVAIEYNLSILPKGKWGDTRVAAGDRIEIVQFVGGG